MGFGNGECFPCGNHLEDHAMLQQRPGRTHVYGDILGDWREEVICTGSDYASLVILSTTVPTQYRNECLAQDPCYRNCMTAKGYY